MTSLLTAVVLAWEAFKDWLSATLHLPHLALHALAGVLIPLLVLRIAHRSPTSLVPLAIVASLEAGNEAMDFTRYAVAGWPWQARATAIEAVVTLAPAVALVVWAHLARSTERTT